MVKRSPVPVPVAPRPAPPKAPEGLGAYPRVRMRRNRADAWSRALVAEHRLAAADLLWPVFVHDHDGRAPIPSMPGVDRLGIGPLVDAAGEARALGIPAIALFPATPPERKTADGDEALNPDNLICRATRAIKQAYPDLGVMCDVALDPFTTHGHDGLLRAGEIVNDETVAVLCRQAVVQAEAGCDIIAPSDMMDGRVGAIRDALDRAGFARDEIHVVPSVTVASEPDQTQRARQRRAWRVEEPAPLVLILPPVAPHSGAFTATWGALVVQRIFTRLRILLPGRGAEAARCPVQAAPVE